jgi:hypothetical protein
LRKSLNKDRSEGLIFDAFESALKVINNQSTSSPVPLRNLKTQGESLLQNGQSIASRPASCIPSNKLYPKQQAVSQATGSIPSNRQYPKQQAVSQATKPYPRPPSLHPVQKDIKQKPDP